MDTETLRQFNMKKHDPKWQAKKVLILIRDNYKCRNCNSTENLQVHHRQRVETISNLDAEDTIDKDLFIEQVDSPSEEIAMPINGNHIAIAEKSTLIDQIFDYVNQDFESRGYQDAIVQPDTHYLNENVELIKNDYQLVIDKAAYKYKEFLTELDFHIATRTSMGLTEIVQGLEAKKKITQQHLAFVEDEMKAIQANKGKVQRIKLSYTKGFKRGASALSNSFITSSNI